MTVIVLCDNLPNHLQIVFLSLEVQVSRHLKRPYSEILWHLTRKTFVIKSIVIFGHAVSFMSLSNPGGRGLRTEVWNETRPSRLADILTYNSSKPGYLELWTDMPQTFPIQNRFFASRTRGFFVPPTSENYTLYLNCDDRCELYLSNSSHPEDKVNIILYITSTKINHDTNRWYQCVIWWELLLWHDTLSPGSNRLPDELHQQYLLKVITKVWGHSPWSRKIVRTKLWVPYRLLRDNSAWVQSSQ